MTFATIPSNNLANLKCMYNFKSIDFIMQSLEVVLAIPMYNDCIVIYL